MCDILPNIIPDEKVVPASCRGAAKDLLTLNLERVMVESPV